MYKKIYVAPAMSVVVTDLQYILAGSGGTSGSGGGSGGQGSDADTDIKIPDGGDGGDGGDGEDGPVVESKPHTNAWSVWDD